MSYIGLVEEHGRNIIEHAILLGNVSQSQFPDLEMTAPPPEEAAQKYIKQKSVEVWGEKYLALAHRSWSDVGGGKIGVVEAFTVRNIVSHGLSACSQTAFNRLQNAGGSPPRWSVGDCIKLDRALFQECIRNLRAFARAVADVGANLP